MGGIISQAFDATNDIAVLISSALGQSFTELISAAVSLLKNIITIFGNSAAVPTKIYDEVLVIGESIGEEQLFID